MRTINVFAIFAVVLLAMVCPQLNAAGTIMLGRGGPLNKLNNSVEVKEQFSGINPANLLPCVYDARNVYLTPETVNSLHYPLFINTECRPSGKAARAILAAANKPKDVEAVVTVTSVNSPTLAAATTNVECPIGESVTILDPGSSVRLESGIGFVKTDFIRDGMVLRGIKPGLVRLAFVSEGGLVRRYVISVLPSPQVAKKETAWIGYKTLSWGLVLVAGWCLCRLKHWKLEMALIKTTTGLPLLRHPRPSPLKG